jgi:hypothetical protein
MKMKIEATQEQVGQLMQIFDSIVEKLDSTLSRLEDEREGDLWRMSEHTPDAEKVDEITREGLAILKEGFSQIKAFTYAE